MEQRIPLAGGRGRLTLSEEEGRVTVTAALPDDRAGLYRLWLMGPGGRVLAGTFLPADGELTIRRTIPTAELARRGAWPVRQAAAELFFRAGQAVPPPRPERSQSQQPLQPLPAEVRFSAPFRLRLLDGVIAADIPWRPGQEHPSPELFCLSALHWEGQTSFLRFCFTPSGAPCLPEGGRGK